MEMNYPKTRMDNFFAKAAGSDLADYSMEPITDRESGSTKWPPRSHRAAAAIQTFLSQV